MPGTAKYRKSGNVRDPNAPKLHLSPYLLFAHKSRGAILSEKNGLDFGGLSKETGTRWKQMTENEKRKWVKASNVSFLPCFPSLHSFPPLLPSTRSLHSSSSSPLRLISPTTPGRQGAIQARDGELHAPSWFRQQRREEGWPMR